MKTSLTLALLLLAACDANPSAPLPGSQLIDPGTLNLTLQVRGRGELVHSADVTGATSCSTLASAEPRVDCVRSYAVNASVTLDPKPAAGMAFDHFSGVCAGKVPCTLTMNERRTIEVIFMTVPAPPPPAPPAATSYPLTLRVRGKGDVKHSADMAGLVSCGTSGISGDGIDCVRTFPAGASIALEAVPAAGFRFAGWSGACTSSGTAPCTLKANEPRTLEVRFVR